MKKKMVLTAMVTAIVLTLQAQEKMKPEDTEVWSPVPKVVTPGHNMGDPPSDAIVLFNGSNLNQWVSVNDSTKTAQWKVAKGTLTVDKKSGNIQTRQAFTDYQLHIEWQIPQNITGKGQVRGNSGIFLASTGSGDAGYELQILDSYNNPTYVNGQAGSIYKQQPPLANVNRPPGSWNVYDIAWTAPRFNTDGTIKTPAKVTVLVNGVLVQYNYELTGETVYIGKPAYHAHGAAPIKLQAHGDPSEPVSFRNIWIRPLDSR